MINKLIAFAIQQRLLVGLALVALVAWGVISYQSLPIDAFPDVTNNQVQILTNVVGFTPVEVEKQITYPIEIEMSSLPGLVESRSVSQFGLSSITLVFKDEMDVYFARQLVFERLGVVADALPEGVTPEMGPVSSGLGEVYQYTIDKQASKNVERMMTVVNTFGIDMNSISHDAGACCSTFKRIGVQRDESRRKLANPKI